MVTQGCRRSGENDSRLDEADGATADPLGDDTHSDELASAVDQLDPVPGLAVESPEEHRLPVRESLFLLGVCRDLRKGQGNLVERHPTSLQILTGLEDCSQVTERYRIVYLERTDLQTAELCEMRAAPEVLPKIVCHTSDVGPGGATQAERE